MALGNVHQIRPVCPFATGALVCLNGGSAIMTVTEELFSADGKWFVECVWHNDSKDPVSDTYPVASLYETAIDD